MKTWILVLLIPFSLFSREPKDILEESKPVAKVLEEEKTEEALLIHHWLSYTPEVAIHQQRGAKGNKVFLGPGGHQEAVYDSEGNLVQDGINDGSYNFAHPFDDPVNHFLMDILPWICWGNSDADPTSIEERLRAYSVDLGVGLATAQQNKRKAIGIDELTEGELEGIAVFLRIVEEGEIAEVYNILRDSTYEPEEPFAIGRGITNGLLSVIIKRPIK